MLVNWSENQYNRWHKASMRALKNELNVIKEKRTNLLQSWMYIKMI